MRKILLGVLAGAVLASAGAAAVRKLKDRLQKGPDQAKPEVHEEISPLKERTDEQFKEFEEGIKAFS
jgi:hypothetical protein